MYCLCLLAVSDKERCTFINYLLYVLFVCLLAVSEKERCTFTTLFIVCIVCVFVGSV